ncbi:MAG: undecaprenyl-diphosphate phosphatase [Bdellovibrionota bacterium]
MEIWESVLYGAVQGLTEYLPISSSAHLILLPRFLGRTEPGLSFDVFLHIGTLLATLLYFRKEWLALARDPLARRGQNAISITWIILATLPALLMGAAMPKWIATVLRGNAILMVTLPLGGFLLWGVDHWAKGREKVEQLGIRRAFAVGVFQCLALVPGMSRSGSTMLGGRFLGLDRGAAARFSFLISGPITAAAVVFELRHWGDLIASFGDAGKIPLVMALVSSFGFGWLAIDGLLRLVNRLGFAAFAFYRALLALTIFWYLGV